MSGEIDNNTPLQFEKAEFQGPKCTSCQQDLGDSFYQLAGDNICAACAEAWRAGQGTPGKQAMVRAALYGLGAAVGGAILMAVTEWVTGAQWALISIAVGYLVGKAVRKGADGLGSRKCQILAVALTYFGITASYLPAFFKGFEEAERAEQAKAGSKSGKTENPPVTAAAEPVTAASAALAFSFLIGLALVAPFLILFEGFSGVLNALIIFFGLSQAWRLTAADDRALAGPMSAVAE